jgi:hypothetical protein
MREFQPIIGMQADQGQQLADAVLDLPLALDQAEGTDRLGDDGIDPKARIEARIRVLENHLDAAAQAPPCLALPRIGHRYAVDRDFARTRRQ